VYRCASLTSKGFSLSPFTSDFSTRVTQVAVVNSSVVGKPSMLVASTETNGG